jgi:hypothetical protein
MNSLTPNEARMLDKCLRFCENIMQEDLMQTKTNVRKVYAKVWGTICFHTDDFMIQTVYSTAGILPPVE